MCRSKQCWLLAISLLPLFVVQADAADIVFHAEASVVNKDPTVGPEIEVGDVFHVQFVIDGDAVDENPAPGDEGILTGRFGCTLDLVLARKCSNVGTWDPQLSGTWQLPWFMDAKEIDNGPDYNLITYFNPETPFPAVTIGGEESTFVGVLVVLDAIVEDTGFGQKWTEQISVVNNGQFAMDWRGVDGRVFGNLLDVGIGPHPELLPPEADAGPDQSVHCEGSDGSVVLLDGSGSSDPSGDDLDFEWSVAESSGIVLYDSTSAVTEGVFPNGVHEVTLTVYDVDENGVRKCSVDSDSVLITVLDDEDPVALVTTDVAALWPANGEMVPVTVYVEASDHCTSPNDLDIFCYVSSDQPDDTNGNGNRTGDVDGLDGYTEPVVISLTNVEDGLYEAVIRLRAERASTARTYSIGLYVEDASGNTGEASTTVVVPHDRRRN